MKLTLPHFDSHRILIVSSKSGHVPIFREQETSRSPPMLPAWHLLPASASLPRSLRHKRSSPSANVAAHVWESLPAESNPELFWSDCFPTIPDHGLPDPVKPTRCTKKNPTQPDPIKAWAGLESKFFDPAQKNRVSMDWNFFIRNPIQSDPI